MHHFSKEGVAVHSGTDGTVESGIVVKLEPEYSYKRVSTSS